MFNFFSSKSNNTAQQLVAVVKGSQVAIKTVPTNHIKKTIGYGSNGKPLNCQVSPDLKLVVCTTDKGIVCISEIAVGGIKRTFGHTAQFGSGAQAINASWIDNKTILVNTNKGSAYQVEINTGASRKIS